MTKSITTFVSSLFILLTLLVAVPAHGNHSWGFYHWPRTANPLMVKLGDNLSSVWDAQLVIASADWSQSIVLDTAVVQGQANPKNCRATSGRVEVCNSKYGNNGWLGIASIWASGDHIRQGTVKLNDTYFNTSKYNTPAWKQFVVCQEIGHTFGLDHQDEDFSNANLNTCMDYTSDPSTNQHPNAHDYDELVSIYAHLDSSTLPLAHGKVTAAAAKDINTENPSEWGKSIRTSADGRSTLFERNLGNGQKIFTFVIWAD